MSVGPWRLARAANVLLWPVPDPSGPLEQPAGQERDGEHGDQGGQSDPWCSSHWVLLDERAGLAEAFVEPVDLTEIRSPKWSGDTSGRRIAPNPRWQTSTLVDPLPGHFQR